MFKNLKNLFNISPRLWILIAGAVLTADFFLLYFIATENSFNWQFGKIRPVDQMNHRLLDGELVAKDISSLKPIVVMMENHSLSRPTAGLENASIIYETIIEGDITRFLAIFDPTIEAKKIGPVRSVRPFFVEIAEEWNPVLFHAGGSQDAMYKLTYSKVDNVNEISGDGIYFWRDTQRAMPHNLFTSINQIKRAIEAKEIDLAADFEPWLFKNDGLDRPEADAKLHEVVKVNFNNNPLYQVEYRYNQEDHNYTRYLAGEIHKTDRGIFLKANNIIFQHVNFDVVDSYGRLDVNVTGKGRAEIFQDGRIIEAYWQKPKNSRTKFYDLGNREIKFNRGTIWIELVFN
ncbi:MAG: hypothetical protein CMI53_04685 [Parcubacteria group bacterium]|nr:hypothetical protein [Parcubacteria group bacterium]|tara:strand:+ start:493 stop:1530 length:1038 start_codon:yes stop_codon:yes gene_type:complete